MKKVNMRTFLTVISFSLFLLQACGVTYSGMSGSSGGMSGSSGGMSGSSGGMSGSSGGMSGSGDMIRGGMGSQSGVNNYPGETN